MPHAQALLQQQAWWMSYPPASTEGSLGMVIGGILAPLGIPAGFEARVIHVKTPARRRFRDMRLHAHQMCPDVGVEDGQKSCRWLRLSAYAFRSSRMGCSCARSALWCVLAHHRVLQGHATVRSQALRKACIQLQLPSMPAFPAHAQYQDHTSAFAHTNGHNTHTNGLSALTVECHRLGLQARYIHSVCASMGAPCQGGRYQWGSSARCGAGQQTCGGPACQRRPAPDGLPCAPEQAIQSLNFKHQHLQEGTSLCKPSSIVLCCPKWQLQCLNRQAALRVP